MEVGSVVSRRIGKTGFFHFGIVCRLDPLIIVEHDYDGKHLSSLDEFLYGERELWLIPFATERAKHGETVFRTPKERALKAIRLYKEERPYCAETFNCEHFVRECTFRDPLLWESQQVQRLKANEVGLLGRLSMAVLGIAPKTAPLDGIRLLTP